MRNHRKYHAPKRIHQSKTFDYKNKGIMITGKGIIMVLRTHMNAPFFPGNSSLANAKAAIECTIRANTVTIVATNNEFLIPVKISRILNTCL